MTIRSKLYAGIVVTVLGLGLLAGIGLWGTSALGDHFDAASQAADDRALALELKYDVTDFNGWQTAYGYDHGASRPIFLSSVAAFRADLARARSELTGAAEAAQLQRIQAAFEDFMRLDAAAFAGVQAGRDAEVRRILLGPEISNFHRAAQAADALASLERSRSAAENHRFVDSRSTILRAMVIAALAAGVFCAILLLTATDLARAAEQALAEGSDESTVSPPP